MGQKVNPIGIRLGITKSPDSNWYAKGKDFPRYLAADLKLRKVFNKQYKHAAISKITIERLAGKANVTVHTARPGVLIGKSGSDANALRNLASSILGVDAHVNISEVRKPELNASLVAQNIAGQLEKRVMFRRAMKRAVASAMRLGAEGIKVAVSGRLGGAEIARAEWYLEGRVPLHTFRADIDYATAEALTTYGIIGVKVWIFRGEKYKQVERANEKKAREGKSRDYKSRDTRSRDTRSRDAKPSRDVR